MGSQISAPFDCLCTNSSLVALSGQCQSVSIGGIGGNGSPTPPAPTPPPASQKTDFLFGVALAKAIHDLAIGIYKASCHPCSISMSDKGHGSKAVGSACRSMRDNHKSWPLWMDWNNDESGCTFTVSADSCAAALSSAQNIVQNTPDVAVSYIESADTVVGGVSSNTLAVFFVVVALLATLL